MQYITPELTDFLAGIRANNNKEWFELHKSIYLEKVDAPLKQMGELLFEPYKDIPDMMWKSARIYKDANFPPYLHYRDTMYIYIRHPAEWWNKTPTLFLELSPEGACYGFRIATPEPAFMQYFRDAISDDAEPFQELVKTLEEAGLALTGDEYKRAKPCENPELLPLFKKKSLEVKEVCPIGEKLYSDGFLQDVADVLQKCYPIYEYLYNMMQEYQAMKDSPAPKEERSNVPHMVQAPKHDFMW